MTANKIVHSKQGFTITELLVATFISAVVMTGVYSTFYSQHKAYQVQDQVVSMQQNLRAAIQCMESEIRMAGYDPTNSKDAGIGILTANPNLLQLTMDINDDADTGTPDGDAADTDEDITYSLNSGNLIKNGAANILAENIDAVNFVYLDESGAVLDDDGSGNVTASLSAIRAVQVTIVARTGRTDLGYTDTNAYTNQQGVEILPAQNDGFRRRRLTTEIHCRNLGF